jgi:hypothetical protein
LVIFSKDDFIEDASRLRGKDTIKIVVFGSAKSTLTR